MPDNPKKPTIDERIEALVLTAELQEKRTESIEKYIDSAEKRLKATEREQQRFRAAMRAALQAWTEFESTDSE